MEARGANEYLYRNRRSTGRALLVFGAENDARESVYDARVRNAVELRMRAGKWFDYAQKCKIPASGSVHVWFAAAGCDGV
eukprot:6586244-Pyramimonas_sp.AAC.2